MNIEINVNIKAPELKKLLKKLTELDFISSKEVDNNNKAGINNLKSFEKENSESKITITKEEVRAKLAALNQNGKQDDVKEIIKKYNARKLSEISKEDYPKVMEDIKKLEEK